ncbi:hypothetical protein Ahia01_001014600, partial [Argonauta hians]
VDFTLELNHHQLIGIGGWQRFKKGRSLRKNDELSQEEKTDLKRLTGQMMWVSTQTRPDTLKSSNLVSDRRLRIDRL